MSGLLLAKNRKALFNNSIIEKYSAGIVLKGFEVKALREGNVNFEGSYIQLVRGAPYIVNLNIGRYSKQSTQSDYSGDNTRSMRKLLLNKKEIMEIDRELKTKGHTAVPLAFLLVHNLIKLEFAVVKGKKEFEKKNVTKERQVERDMQRDWKEFHRSNDKV